MFKSSILTFGASAVLLAASSIHHELLAATYRFTPDDDIQVFLDQLPPPLKPGDTITFEEGLYQNDMLELRQSGLPGSPITFRGEGAVTFDGSSVGLFESIAFDTRGVDHIVFDNFSFTNLRTGINVRPGSSDILIDHIQATANDFVILIGNRDQPLTATGPDGPVANITVRNLTARGDRGNGPRGDCIRAEGRRPNNGPFDGLVTNLVLQNIVGSEFSYPPATGDYTQGDIVVLEPEVVDAYIDGLTAFDNGDTGLDSKAGSVLVNRMHAYRNKNNIKTFEGEMTITNSLIYDALREEGTQNPEGFGINIRPGADRVLLSNVTFVNNETVDVRNDSDGSAEVTVRNSIIARDLLSGAPLQGPVNVDDMTLMYNAHGLPTGDDPQFMNWTDHDFHLTNGSPAIDQGDSTLVTRDHFGNVLPDLDNNPRIQGAAIDLGAYEFPQLDGDYNRDGVVDAADYVVWRKNDGTQESFDTWRANFGNNVDGGVSSVSSFNTVPEPVVAVTIITALSVMFLCRRALSLSM